MGKKREILRRAFPIKGGPSPLRKRAHNAGEKKSNLKKGKNPEKGRH